MVTEVDYGAAEIRAGLDALIDCLADPLAQDSLNMDRDAEALDNYKSLIKTKKSLSQYMSRGNTLYYVGLVGHFSSGKSSTINSILSLEGDTARETGPHPTDDAITLITTPANQKDIIGVTREGTLTIRSQPVSSEMLEKYVIVDTPGTGDPGIIEEIARDFLPICDLVLFVLSAAVPLDQADIPILKELKSRLPFLPILFVVTRGGEFSQNGEINHAYIGKFLDTLVTKVNKIAKTSAPNAPVYSSNDFIIIDNKSGYNVNILVSEIKKRTDPGDIKHALSMHIHKQHYFLTYAQWLKRFFGNYVASKLSSLETIFF